MARSQEVRVIRVVSEVKGIANLKQFAANLGLINKNVASLSGGMNAFSRIAGTLFAGFGVSQLATMSDSVQVLKDRLTILTGSTEAAAIAFEDLSGVASRTKTSVADIGIVYARIGTAIKELGVSHSDTIKVVETLQNSFRLSGATTGEATSAAIQLSQGFASGQLRGQELRSVLEANVVVGGILSKTFGVTRGELYKLAEAGQLTADIVMKALLIESGNVSKQAEKLSQTFGQSLTLAMDKLRVVASTLNEKLGVSDGLAGALEYVDKNVLKLIISIGLLSAALATLKIALVVQATASVLSLSGAFTALTAWAVKAKVAVLALGAAAPGLLVLAGALAAASVTTLIFGDDIVTLAEKWGVVKKPIKETGTELEILEKRLKDFDIGTGLNQRTAEFYKLSKAVNEARKAAENFSKLKTMDIMPDSMKADSRWWNIMDPLFAADNMSTDITKSAVEEGVRRQRQALLDQIARGKKTPDKGSKEKFGDFYEINKSITSLDDYTRSLSELQLKLVSQDFAKGQKNFFQLQEAILGLQLEETNRQFNRGAISFEEFNKAVGNNKLAMLESQLAQGAIAFDEYLEKLSKIEGKLSPSGAISVGSRSYLQGIGTYAEQISSATSSTFQALEDSLADSLINMKLDFKSFADSVLNNLARIAIRSQITGPLAGAIEGLFQPTQPGAVQAPASTGGLGSIPATAKVSGGVNYGSSALMGKGTMSGGSPVTINITNNSASDVTTQETTGQDGTKILEVLITSKVREGIASGSFDNQFNQTYGLRRKGF